MGNIKEAINSLYSEGKLNQMEVMAIFGAILYANDHGGRSAPEDFADTYQHQYGDKCWSLIMQMTDEIVGRDT